MYSTCATCFYYPMSHFSSPGLLPDIPDNVSIPQFFLQSSSLLRPKRPSNVPFFIDDRTSRQVTFEQVCVPPFLVLRLPNHDNWQVHRRTNSLANALSAKWSIGLYLILNTWDIEHRIPFTPGQVKATLVCR